jgi:hypothetical protein
VSKYAKWVVTLIGMTLLVLDHYLGPASFASQLIVYAMTSLGVLSVPNSQSNSRHRQ